MFYTLRRVSQTAVHTSIRVYISVHLHVMKFVSYDYGMHIITSIKMSGILKENNVMSKSR
jgi:hypothetical protein